MTADPIADFVEVLRRCRLLGPAQLEELARDLHPRFSEPAALAGELVRRAWLTAYQAGELVGGRGPALVLGQYSLLELLGEGGMGRVYKARHRGLDRVVALKVIRGGRLADPEVVSRFRREVRTVARLSHPNIVHAYDAESVGDTHFLVMEYVAGTDLQALVERNGPPPPWVACAYVRQAALGLEHASRHGVVHRDIKPSNLLVTADGPTVKILDMGLALLNRADGHEPTTLELTRHGLGTVLGTLDYLAPEQGLDPHAVDVRADLYALGCTLHYLLTGRVPFPGGTVLEKLFRHCWEKPRPVEQLRPGVSPELGAVVRKLMAKHPEDRYQTPAEAAEALGPFARKPRPGRSGPVVPADGARPPPGPGIPSLPGRAPGWRWALLALAWEGLLLCVFLVGYWTLDSREAGWLALGVAALGLATPLASYALFRLMIRRPPGGGSGRPESGSNE
jgi:serine/threonine protein kinase